MGCHWQSVGLKETVAGLSLAECRTKGNSEWAVTVRLKETGGGLSVSVSD